MKTYLVSFIFLVSFFASAQDCSFNDSIFESILKTQNLNDSRLQVYFFDSLTKLPTKFILDADNNKKISKQEANKVFALYLSDGPTNTIKSLNGLTCFSSISKLSLTGIQADSLSIYNPKLSILHLIDNPGLKAIKVPNAVLDTMIVATNPLLITIDVGNNMNIKMLDCSNNTSLKNINVNNCTNLSILSSINSSISTIDISTNNSLKTLILKNNSLNKISLKNNTLLQIIILDDNPLDSINLMYQPDLQIFSCNNTHIKMLDMSYNYKLKTLDLSNNANLDWINLKNGSLLNELYTINLPVLQYVCTDEINKKFILDAIKLNAGNAIEVNTFCSDRPGGYINSIRGRLKFDSDGNGCDINDTLSILYSKFSITSNSNIQYSFTNELNEAKFYVNKGDFLFKPLVDTSFFQVIPKLSNHTFKDSLNRDTLYNFCISPKNLWKDVEILIVPHNSPLIGDTCNYTVLIRNKSAVSTDGNIALVFIDSLVQFSNSPSFSLTNNNTLTTTFSKLLPFETRKFNVNFKIKNKFENTSISAGDTLFFRANVSLKGVDTYADDNEFTFSHVILDSVKSNYMMCLNGNVLQVKKKNLPINYLIDYEDKINLQEKNVVIKQKLDTIKFDAKSVQIIQISKPAKIDIIDNNIYYYIEYKSGEHKHGNILLRYSQFKENNTKDTLVEKADIYFGNHSPIGTNTEITILKEKLLAEIKGLKIDQSIKIFPNPSNGLFSLTSASQLKEVEIYDINGRIIQSMIGNEYNKIMLDISSFESGIYLLKIISSSGVNILEFRKE